MEHTPTDDDIATLSVGELKALISGAGLSYADCVEKSDLRARAAEARAGLAAAAASEPPENSAVATYRAWRAETDAAQAAYQANKDEALARFRRFTNKVHDAWQRNSPERILHLMRTPRMKVTMAKLPADQKNWTGRYLVKGRCGACQRKKLVPSIPLGYKNLTSSYG